MAKHQKKKNNEKREIKIVTLTMLSIIGIIYSVIIKGIHNVLKVWINSQCRVVNLQQIKHEKDQHSIRLLKTKISNLGLKLDPSNQNNYN